MAQESNAERQAREAREKADAEAQARIAAARNEGTKKEKQDIEDFEIYDIFNPTRGGRNVYDGINIEDYQQQMHTVPPGGVKLNVRLDKFIVDEMAKRNRKQKNSDVIIAPAGQLKNWDYENNRPKKADDDE